MDAARVVLLTNPTHLGQLREDVRRAGGAGAGRVLVVTCSESLPVMGRLRAEDGEFVLRVPAGRVLASGVPEAISYALEHAGVRLLLVVGHTRCGHLDSRSELRHPPANSGYERLVRGAVHHHADLRAAREHVLRQVRALQEIPAVSRLLDSGELEVQGGLYSEALGVIPVHGPEADSAPEAPAHTRELSAPL